MAGLVVTCSIVLSASGAVAGLVVTCSIVLSASGAVAGLVVTCSIVLSASGAGAAVAGLVVTCSIVLSASTQNAKVQPSGAVTLNEFPESSAYSIHDCSVPLIQVAKSEHCSDLKHWRLQTSNPSWVSDRTL